eukprot:CAMPEP_0196826324 /NCGR_PEP_ID=MMETSP1362-20130617/93566_1 /TAXON_ID=163516 /ORGANISM="Leptocylindrus danicus, Strain CCMP1856" /LENGTH=697 /DNA_ID=CAMNT_0042206891 /DNA_START=744 /DNA_END=2837 /DNA_ORIENTATION=+
MFAFDPIEESRTEATPDAATDKPNSLRVKTIPHIDTSTRETHYSFQVRGRKPMKFTHTYFTIDEILGFHEVVKTRDAYESALRKIMQSVMSGFNRTVFVEGSPPGFGPNIPIDVLKTLAGSAVNADICWELFSIAMERPYQEFSVSATLVEVMAGEVRDLLADNQSFKDPSSTICNDLSCLHSLLVTGEKNRMAESHAPSGGHIVFRLMFKNEKAQMSPDKQLKSTESALNLVFLNTTCDLLENDNLHPQLNTDDTSNSASIFFKAVVMLGIRARRQHRPRLPDRSLCLTVLCGSSMLSMEPTKSSVASSVQQVGSFSPWSETKFLTPQSAKHEAHHIDSPDSTATQTIMDDMCALREHIDSLTHQKDDVMADKERLERQVIQLLTEKQMNDEYMVLLTKLKDETDAQLKYAEADNDEILIENRQLKEQIFGLENNVKQLSNRLAARDTSNALPRHDSITTLHEAARNLYRGHTKRNSMSSDEFDRILAKLNIRDLNRTVPGTSNLSAIRSTWNIQLKQDLESAMSKLTPIGSPLLRNANTSPSSEDKSTNTEPTLCIDLFSGFSSSSEIDSDLTTNDCQWTTDLFVEKKAAIDAWETVIRRSKADSPTNSRESVVSDLTADLYTSPIRYPDLSTKEVLLDETENEALLQTGTIKCKQLFLCPIPLIRRNTFLGKKSQRNPTKEAKITRTAQTMASF